MWVVCAALIVGVWVCVAPAEADSVSMFGPLPGATFGGSGIPNDAVAITTITDGQVTITLGLAAHARFDNPLVTNDGNGTFFAQPGTRISPDDPSMLDVAMWNFDFYVDVDGASFEDYQFNLLYDVDNGATTDFGTLDLNAAVVALGGTLGSTSLVEGSENLSFDFLYDIPIDFPFIAPPGGSFNPDAGGLYSFQLTATRVSDAMFLGSSSMAVSVVPVPPAAAMGLVGLGLVALLRRRSSVGSENDSAAGDGEVDARS
jgi:MYXO-CTERM domain-containing protein